MERLPTTNRRAKAPAALVRPGLGPATWAAVIGMMMTAHAALAAAPDAVVSHVASRWRHARPFRVCCN